MDSRLFYSAFQHALQSVVWEVRGDHEYVVVGDGITIDRLRLQSLVSQTFNDAMLCCPLSRREVLQIPSSDAAGFISDKVMPAGVITMSDTTLSVFLQVRGNGVARTGRSEVGGLSRQCIQDQASSDRSTQESGMLQRTDFLESRLGMAALELAQEIWDGKWMHVADLGRRPVGDCIELREELARRCPGFNADDYREALGKGMFLTR